MQKLSLSWHSRYKSDATDVEIVSSALQERGTFQGDDTPCHRAACCYLDKFQIRLRAWMRGSHSLNGRNNCGFLRAFARQFFEYQISWIAQYRLNGLAEIISNRIPDKNQHITVNIGKFRGRSEHSLSTCGFHANRNQRVIAERFISIPSILHCIISHIL